ncbi:transcriptional regulator, LacI family [Janthinobacterium sp. TND4EL3]|uniref:LacI family DNA-binding transcriptional regulator n=1 Tax=Janthinobacterium sp. TND4EL3 TaxID=1907311 RepID=UPI000955432D|nr:LacI family DNA-binding transcriptional regulator [Janthinobacterium sp. TND4EL3]SIR65411.1 transcriptional regulator, LacI family [Janthinobacterium sp. TND4EL3]
MDSVRGSKKTVTGEPARPVTIAQVAREAGVSKTSVSRFLGGELDALSENIRQQIAGTIARLGYQPNQMARGLKRGRTRLIGMVVADMLNPYTVAVLQGVEAACQQHGYTLILCNTGNDEQRERQSLAALRSYSVEGLIVNTQGRNIESSDLQQADMPIVLVDRRIDGADFDLVGLDNVQAGRLATAHLIEQGFDAIAFIAPPLTGVSSRLMRAEGFQAVMAEHPGCVGEVLAVDLDDRPSIDAQVRQCLAQWRGRRVALLASNGMVALELALMLQRLELRMPQDVGLLGFDELPWSPLAGLSTIEQQTYEIGFTAMKCMLSRLQGEQCAPREVLLPGKLIVRNSTQGGKADKDGDA